MRPRFLASRACRGKYPLMRRFAVLLLALASACAMVESSALPTNASRPPSIGPVVVSATRDPAGAEELGVVEAHTHLQGATLDQIVAAFCARVAQLGGNLGRIDNFATTFETVEETYTYECGTTVTETQTQVVSTPGPNGTTTTSAVSVPVTHYVSKTCTGTRQGEVTILTLTGRAFRATKGTP